MEGVALRGASCVTSQALGASVSTAFRLPGDLGASSHQTCASNGQVSSSSLLSVTLEEVVGAVSWGEGAS